MKSKLDFLLRNKYLRAMYVFSRMVFFIKIRRKMAALENPSDAVSEKTIESNRRRVIVDKQLPPHPRAKYFLGLDLDVIGGKSLRFINFLQCFYEKNVSEKKVLIVGPRNEAELFTFVAGGLPLKNLSAIDLFSYSPNIQVMDMHEMQFEQEMFDIVYAGWVIAYSENREKALSEFFRVTKPGGLICITASFSDVSNEEMINQRGYMIGSKVRLRSEDDLLAVFHGAKLEGSVILRTAPYDAASNRSGMVCFQKEK